VLKGLFEVIKACFASARLSIKGYFSFDDKSDGSAPLSLSASNSEALDTDSPTAACTCTTISHSPSPETRAVTGDSGDQQDRPDIGALVAPSPPSPSRPSRRTRTDSSRTQGGTKRVPPAQPASLMPKERQRRGWVPADPSLVAAARSIDADWWTLNVNAPGPDHERIVNLIRTTAGRKTPGQPFGLIAVSVAGQDHVHDHVHIVTTSHAGSQAVRRQFAGVARAVTGKKVHVLGPGLDGVLGYWQKNAAIDGGRWIISQSVRAARCDALAGLELPNPKLDRLFDGMIGAESRHKPADADEWFLAVDVALDPHKAL
jgi:hypothetical protein